MRNRKVQILFRLTDDEAEQLHELVRKSGRSREAFLREMVKGYRLCEKPDPEFVDTPMLNEEARKWHEFQIDVRKRYLLPKRTAV